MVAAVTAVRIADRSPVDQSASASSSFGANSVSSTSNLGATSSFEVLLLQQIGISLPPQSAYDAPAETGVSETSKTPSSNDDQWPVQKPKEDLNTTAVNYFFVPTTLLGDTPPAETADLHPVAFDSVAFDSVAFDDGKGLTSKQPGVGMTSEEPAGSAKNKPTTNTAITSNGSESSLETTTAETSPSTVEAAKHDPSASVPDRPSDSKVPQLAAAETLSVIARQSELPVTQPVQSASVRPSNASGEIQSVDGTRLLSESMISLSTLNPGGRSSQLEQNQSDSNADRDSSDDSKQTPAKNDAPHISTTTFFPTLGGVTDVRFSSPDSSSSISSQLSTAIADKLNEATGEGPTTVRIRLEQKELGTIDVHLSVHEGVVSIRIAAADQLTQQLINGQMDELRQSLTQRGVNFGDMQASNESGGQQSSCDQGSSHTGSIRITPPSRFWRQPLAATTTSRANSGLLNYVA
ncbi:flagellar hook-length control protein FliK [Schlesneria paludicola]|uniref:flagellar hook-length control protein FliK n=1 Tax=Schlesneria paludicola TaxID=360056 RepID=UPI00029A83A8|nr:flagellar hook-length control protein FliK [Schlesneria paludicola]